MPAEWNTEYCRDTFHSKSSMSPLVFYDEPYEINNVLVCLSGQFITMSGIVCVAMFTTQYDLYPH